MALALARLGCERALIVHGEEGLDELSPSGPSLVWEVIGNQVRSFEESPGDAGLATHPLSSVIGGTAEDNAFMLRSVLGGEPGALRDFTLLNASAALLAFDLARDLIGGVRQAAEAIDSGGALGKLERFVEVSNALE